MAKYKLNRVEMKWIVAALNHNIADIKEEMDASEDGSPIYAIGEVILEGRQNLVRKLNDIIFSDVKIIGIE